MSEQITEKPANDQQKAAETAVETAEPPTPTEGTPEPETFPRAVVEELRRENAEQRTKAKRADEMSRRLHLELVRATGRLADPDDLGYDEAHLEDVDVLDAAIDELLTRKAHLASRRPRGDVGQGATVETAGVDLAGMLRARAG